MFELFSTTEMIAFVTETSLERTPHQYKHSIVISFHVLTSMTKTLGDDGQEHAQTHEYHHKHEQRETEWTEKSSGTCQLLRIEFQQRHLEEGGCRS
jgi:hypothetical protein